MNQGKRSLLVAGIVSLVILGFGLLSISEGSAGELSKEEMGVVKGAAGCISCYIRELVAAENGSCPTCEQGCAGKVYVVPQYYKCAGAGVGESGREICVGSSQPIGIYYPCENRFSWGKASIALLKAGARTLPACASCFVFQNWIACAPCIAAVLWEFGIDLGYCDFHVCVKGIEKPVNRHVFSALLGEACVGE